MFKTRYITIQNEHDNIFSIINTTISSNNSILTFFLLLAETLVKDNIFQNEHDNIFSIIHTTISSNNSILTFILLAETLVKERISFIFNCFKLNHYSFIFNDHKYHLNIISTI